jgi:hypothetical protein
MEGVCLVSDDECHALLSPSLLFLVPFAMGDFPSAMRKRKKVRLSHSTTVAIPGFHTITVPLSWHRQCVLSTVMDLLVFAEWELTLQGELQGVIPTDFFPRRSSVPHTLAL